jgi:hypothetical protein
MMISSGVSFLTSKVAPCYSHPRLSQSVKQSSSKVHRLGLRPARSVAAEDGEKRVAIRLLESGLKAKLVAVKSDGLIDVADDEEREIAGVVGRVISVEPLALAVSYLRGLLKNAILLFNAPRFSLFLNC